DASGAALGGRLGTLLDAPFASLDPALRVRAVLGALFALLLVRNLLVFLHGAAAGGLTSRTAHELRAHAVAVVVGAEEETLAARDMGAWLNLLESQTWETAAALGALAGIATRACKVFVFTVALVALSWRLTATVAIVLGVVSLGVRVLA